MAIDFNSLNSAQLRGGHAAQTERNNEDALPKQAADTKPSQTEETVHITDRATNLNKIQKTLAELPVIDTQKVESIRQALKDGSYEVNSEKVAEKLLAFDEDLAYPDKEQEQEK